MADFEVFVSWSRPASHQAAGAFQEWLPGVLPGVRTWTSSEDITKGAPWFSSISDQLGKSEACLIMITPENVGSAWLFYEAGAIAHAMPGALICPYLIGVKPGELSGTPLGQYQVTVFDKDDTWLLIRALNTRLETPHHEDVLRGNFDTRWPFMQRRLAQVAASASRKPIREPAEPEISEEARHVLLEAAKDPHGTVLMLKTTGGFALQAHGQQLVDGNDVRVEAAYREAVNDLVSRRLLETRGGKGEVFTLTKRGWRMSDELRVVFHRRARPVFDTLPEGDRNAILRAVGPLRGRERDQWPSAGARPLQDVPLAFVVRAGDELDVIVTQTEDKGVEVVDIIRLSALKQFDTTDEGRSDEAHPAHLQP
jgi:hypothetical protein